MRVSAVTCSLALVLAACGDEPLTAPPPAPAATVRPDTAARVQGSSPNVSSSESETSAACSLFAADDSVRSQIEALGICEADIESIEVIKGAAAAVLYGNGGRHASIFIVTKAKTSRVAS